MRKRDSELIGLPEIDIFDNTLKHYIYFKLNLKLCFYFYKGQAKQKF